MFILMLVTSYESSDDFNTFTIYTLEKERNRGGLHYKNDNNDDDNDDLGAGDRELTFLNLPRTRCIPCLLL